MNNEEQKTDVINEQLEMVPEPEIIKPEPVDINEVSTNDLIADDNQTVEVKVENQGISISESHDQSEADVREEKSIEIAETINIEDIANGLQADETSAEVVQDSPIQESQTVPETKSQSEEILSEAEKAAPTNEELHEEQVSRSQRQKYFDEVFLELKEKMEKHETVEVELKARIRGGLRVHYRDVPLFLPTSHFTLKRNPSEEEMQNAIGQKVNVHVHEYQEFDEGRKAVIVSCRQMLLEDVWHKIQVNDIVEGKVSSIASFGVFVEFDGIEGLIHISRLSKIHIDDPNKFFKKGQDIKAKIIEIDKSNNRIALSRKELEDSPWKGTEEEFKAGTQFKGIVRRLTDFGAYVEIKPGVDGLLRNNELSWTKRVKKPSEILSPGQEILVEVISISEDKENASLSYKKTQANPWIDLAKKYPIGSEFEGTILQVIPQGAIVNIADDLDGFMPRSKMRPVMKGKKIPYKSGDKVSVIISDINPAEESLILAPKAEEEIENRPPVFERKAPPKPKAPTNSSSFSLGDMLSDSEMEKLQNFSK